MNSQAAKPAIAAFDFDGTITWSDSFLPFLRHAVGFARFWSGLAILSPWMAAYAAGRIANDRLKERFLTTYLKGWSETELDAAAKSFCKSGMARLVNRDAMERLRWHADQGHRILIISASPEFYLRVWAETAGVDDVIGTRLDMSNGRVSGRLTGPNCHGEEKVRRFESQVGPFSELEVFAYGDSKSDLPLLNRAAHAFYKSLSQPVNILEKLRLRLAWLGLLVG